MVSKAAQLRDALEHLAGSADDQVRYVKSMPVLGDCVDELALEWEDAAGFIDGLFRRGEITQFQYDCISSLKELVDSLDSEDVDLWKLSALHADARWARIREKASECLSALKRTDNPQN